MVPNQTESMEGRRDVKAASALDAGQDEKPHNSASSNGTVNNKDSSVQQNGGSAAKRKKEGLIVTKLPPDNNNHGTTALDGEIGVLSPEEDRAAPPSSSASVSAETDSTATNEFSGLETIPPCSARNLSLIMTRSIENIFYR